MCAVLGVAALACAEAQPASDHEPTIVISGLKLPSAIAVDQQGFLYVVDVGCGVTANQPDCSLLKETLSGGTYTQSEVATFSTANLPTSVAVDGSGNVYVGVTGKGIYKESPTGSGYTQTSIGCAFAKPTALAFDGKESFLVADADTNRVYREKATDTCATATVVASLTNVTGLAVDSCGSIYIAQSTGATAIVKETPSNGGYVQSAVGSGVAGLIGVAVDGHQDVYYADVMGSVGVLVPSGQDYTQHTVMSKLPLSPIGGMATDGANNFYYADFTNNRIWKAAPSFVLPSPPPCGADVAAPKDLKATEQPK